MKKNIILSVGIASTILLSGCTNTPSPSTPQGKKQEMINVVNNLPKWVINPKVEGGIASVGIAGYSKYGLEVMLPQAEMDARAKLAGQIQTIVSQVQKKALRHTKINELDEFDKAFKQASKEVIKKMPISGAQRIDMFQSKDGTLYVHEVIQKREVSKYLGDMKDTYKKHMQEAKLSRENIDEGMKVLAFFVFLLFLSGCSQTTADYEYGDSRCKNIQKPTWLNDEYVGVSRITASGSKTEQKRIATKRAI